MQSTLYGETKKASRETCITCVFELLSYQNNSLYGETEQHYQKTCILSDIYIVRYQNAKMQSKAWGKEKILQVTYLLSVFVNFRHQNTKNHGKHLIWE